MKYQPRRAKKRDANEAAIIAAFRAVGASVHQINEHVDLVIGYAGVTCMVEVKSAKGKLTAEEDVFFLEHRGLVALVRSPEEAVRLVERIRDDDYR